MDVIHAERSQTQRTAVIDKFRAGDIWVLICTDLMARGFVEPMSVPAPKSNLLVCAESISKASTA